MTDKRETELRSYGRRRGRKPSDRQAELLRDYLPKVAVDPLGRRCREAADEGVDSRNHEVSTPLPTISTPSPQGERGWAPGEEGRPLWLEIGFGGGEHLVWQARQNPHVAFIGCEPFEDGVVKVLGKIADENLGNIRLHMGDARDVMRWLPEASVARAFILFPDPWPKKKHRKRRLVNPQTLDLLADAMAPGAELRIGTDIADYARTMLLAFQSEPRFEWQAASPQDWRLRPSDWPPTRYEQKAEREGRRRYYFKFQRI